MQYLRCYFILISIFIACAIEAQELPPITTYTPQQYLGENQNWAISQADSKFIYIANNKGLLEYNGSKWKLHESPNETIIRSVNVIGNKIYTGCYMEFGYWQKDNFGKLIYNSLITKLKTPLIEDEQFWNIIQQEHWVIFQSLNRIYIFNTNDETFQIIESEVTITKIYHVGSYVYFQKKNIGIFRIEQGKAVLVSNDNMVKDNIVVNIFLIDGDLIILTRSLGFFKFYNNKWLAWKNVNNTLLKDVSVYSCIQLKDKSVILGTISDGLIHISPSGKIQYHINQNNGLNNNTVLSLFEDKDNNIWCGLDNGINCINTNAPYRIYNDKDGNLGAVYTSKIVNNNLYLGTNQGLFFKPLNREDDFKFVTGTQGQVWSLTLYDGILFCGHDTGTFLVKNDTALKISTIQGSWNIKPIPNNSNLLLQGNYDGLYVLEKQNNSWKVRNKIEGFDISSRFFEILKNDIIFVSHEYKGVYRFKVDTNYYKVIEQIKEPISKGSNSSLVKYNNTLVYAFKDGVYNYSLLENEFIKDSLLSKLYNSSTFTSGKLIADNTSNRLWSFSSTSINYLIPGRLSQTPQMQSIAIPSSLRKDVTSYESVLHIKDQSYLFGTLSGYYVLDLSKMEDRIYNININDITLKNNKNVDNTQRQDITIKGDFSNKQNHITFSYSIPDFNKFQHKEYQHQLLGMYDEWSSWTTETKVSFANLPHGEYTFNVKGKIGNTITNNLASYNFSIERPLLLSNTFIVIYILALLLFSFVMHNLYKRFYRNQNRKLLEKSQRDLELKEMENQQQSMHFKNERLELEIENKNRELAISTMSLIKKNEFLNHIKGRLKNTNSDNDIQTIITVINKNLNNTDDWKLFEEAFNNADKDFLKKIKSIHVELTSSDLRLCAYLRLNLSSKEIAPLLNISPRSVEVKRYRLRKKMNLPRDKSLTNYVLEL